MGDKRTALITGANRGIGRAVAEELHRRGLRVIVTARSARDAATAAREIVEVTGGGAGGGIGGEVVGEALDVTDAAGVRDAARRIGAVDVLVSNAGVLLDAGTDPLTVPLDVVERTLAVNLLGAWRVAQAFVPGMVSRGWGRVVFVSSGIGTFSIGLAAGTPAYSVSKVALNGLTTMLAARTAAGGVLVNAVNPGQTRTRMMPTAPRTAAEAALDVAHAATLPDDGPTGTLLRGTRPVPW
ncbi:3-oxoacyl-[acyl-carrier-protein] reductase FabG [Nonomuraea coxensis DSM 45129]|uniref:3-oxoacyl-[acyl-carrier-protein] reductase FabG n=1 Tax=Nonomuraea coxensis DSM 45129 TaxID=1122611 RepID=A0ABX8U0E1_9ACTN|nr:SDR family NAD(P)-dependent oxidoreductase [Nonomuraea coxensis]QYC40152.1 3-oxoacyl-[acyl-carrier-protein] reductase FabG [Nonomuraea coxensis DSM 45129]